MAGAVAEPDGRQFDAGAGKGVGLAGQFERYRDIFQRGHRRQQVKGLQHDADPPAPRDGERVLASVAKSSPATLIVPPLGRSSPASTAISEDLPEPDGPSSATLSPADDVEIDTAQDIHPRRRLRPARA